MDAKHIAGDQTSTDPVKLPTNCVSAECLWKTVSFRLAAMGDQSAGILHGYSSGSQQTRSDNKRYS
ncbi:unnamed protein product [Rhodiola kirilowii]